jgi:hypothetical protein
MFNYSKEGFNPKKLTFDGIMIKKGDKIGVYYYEEGDKTEIQLDVVVNPVDGRLSVDFWNGYRGDDIDLLVDLSMIRVDKYYPVNTLAKSYKSIMTQ